MTRFDKKPTEPNLEAFNLTDQDVINVKSHIKDKEYGVGCSIASLIIPVAICFVSIAILSAVPVACAGGGESVILTIAGIVSLIFMVTMINSSQAKVKVPEEKVIAYTNLTKAQGQFSSDLYSYNKLQEDHWFSMSGHEFEHEFGKLLEDDGYSVTYTQGSGDGGIDLVARKNGRETIIQCKAWKNPVGPAPLRELQGVRSPEQDAWMVGLGGFTNGAIEFAKQKHIQTISYQQVAETVERQLSKHDMKGSIDSGGNLII